MKYLLAAWLLCLALPAQAQTVETPDMTPPRACWTTLLACSDEHPHCNAITCSDGTTVMVIDQENATILKRHPSLLWPSLALVVGESFDEWSTERSVQRGAREMNPLLQSPAARIGATVAASAVVILIMHAMQAQGHPRAAAMVGYAAGAFSAGIAWHNARTP